MAQPIPFGSKPIGPIPFGSKPIAPVAPAPPAQPQQKDFLTKATDTATGIFPGTKAIGESLGTAAFNVGQLFQSKNPFTNPSKVAGVEQPGPNPASQVDIPKAIGGYAAAAGTIASLAAPIPKAATVLGAAGKAALQTGAFSAITGGGQTLSETGNLAKAAKSAFMSGLTGVAIGAVAGAATKGIENFANSKTPEHLYNNALRVLGKVKEKGRSPATFLKNEKVWGSLGTFSKASQEGIDAESAAIKSKIVSTIATKGDVPTLYATVKQKAVEALKGEFGGLYSKAQIEQLVDSVPVAQLQESTSGLGLEATDALRSKLGSLLGNTKWAQDNPTQNTKAAKAVYRVMADIIKENTGTATEFSRLSKWLDTRKVVDRAVHLADSKYGLGLYDAIGGGAGALLGSMTGEGDVGTRLKNAALGGVTGLALERGVNSPALKTGIAQLITKTPAVPQVLQQIGRAGVTTGLGRLFSPTNQ